MLGIASFEGIRIYIYNGDHLSPHIHAVHGDEEALLIISTETIYEGWLPNKQMNKTKRWLENNKTSAAEVFRILNPQLYAPRKKKT